MLRHKVKPGITGWAQLCYPYGSSEKDALEKLQYDLYYVKNHSLFLDFVILFETVGVVLTGKGEKTRAGGGLPPGTTEHADLAAAVDVLLG